MKHLALLLAAGVFATPVFAADIIEQPPLEPVATWTGFYVGLQGGGAFNPDDPNDLDIVTNGFGINQPIAVATGTTFSNANSGFLANTIGAAFGNSFESDFDSSFVGGGHIGYDYQIGSFVVGAVADINATDISISQSAFSNTPAFYKAEREIDYLVTGRLRAGYTVTPTTLVYATGGFAYADVDYSFSTDSPAVLGNGRSLATARAASVNGDDDDFGYTVGGGFDVMVTPNITFGAEYLYTNLGSSDSFTRLDGGPFDGSNTNGGGVLAGNSTDFVTTGDFDFHTITAKVAYRFN